MVRKSHRIHGSHGIFTYIWLNFMVNVGKYTLHASYGNMGIEVEHLNESSETMNASQTLRVEKNKS